jgi:translation initiation factor 5A
MNMAGKLIDAASAKTGNAIFVNEVPCIVRSNDMSKTGKHGHTKCRIEAISILDGKKKVFVAGGHERLEVPTVNKNKGQILSIIGDTANIMDLTSFESMEITIPEELKESLKEEDQVEYWDAEGSKIIKRKL